MRNTFGNIGTDVSSTIYSIKEQFLHYSYLFGIPFGIAFIMTSMIFYFGEGMWMSKPVLSTYLNSYFSFSASAISFNGVVYPADQFNEFALKVFEMKNLFYWFIGIFSALYIAVYFPVAKVYEIVLTIHTKNKTSLFLRGSRVINGKDYSMLQREDGNDKGLILSFNYTDEEQTEEEKEAVKPLEIKQFKNGELKNEYI